MSSYAQKIKKYYDHGLWTREMVEAAYNKGKITLEELHLILDE